MNTDNNQILPLILKRLCRVLGTDINNGKIEIPENAGKGYCTGYIFNQYIRMFIFNYELNKEILITEPDTEVPKRMILFKFRNIFPEAQQLPKENRITELPSVLIATSKMNSDMNSGVSIHTNMATINIEIDADYLSGLFPLYEKSPVLDHLLQNTRPLLFEQIISPSLMSVVNEILSGSVNEIFQPFFFRIKAEELVCRLLMELEKREQQELYPLNAKDIQTLYKVKERMLFQLATPPAISDLTAFAHMSPTKLKRLFRQIFGNSIFNYYQEFRMKEAARLLKEDKLSVSDVGYQLGFTNLSHFSRVFKEHTGMNPKQYSRS